MHKASEAAVLLEGLDLGQSIAELDTLLETARVETSAFADLYQDKVDLIPGTKGSGKSALFRMFVDFLPGHLLKSRKVVVAHGVQKHGDHVFHAFKSQFENLTEEEFVGFWCIYLTSLAHEQFVKGERYQDILKDATPEIEEFRRACAKARIPEIKAKKSLKDVLEWTLNVLLNWKPSLRYKLPHEGGAVELDLFGKATERNQQKDVIPEEEVPHYIGDIKDRLEAILTKTNLSIWLMIDQLDEIFPRRTELETRALRGLLKATRLFTTSTIRIKIFLRDDMLEQAVSVPEGFTALTHLTARQADTLRWSEENILIMIVKRLFANEALRNYLGIDADRLEASHDYRLESFYKVFPATVHRGSKQSRTLHWICTHTMDGRNVVTPRDVLDLITKAKQRQQDEFNQAPESESPWLIGPEAIQYGLEELSKRKRDTYLKAEFPHLWPHIEKFESGNTEYGCRALMKVLGNDWESVSNELVSIGLLGKRGGDSDSTYWFPYVYRKGLNLTRGKAG